VRLAHAIADRGLILTEFPPGTPPLAANFPIRNRLISGITLGTVIVEATSRSGSLITARTAAEQGREVFAVPGSIFAAGTEGTHRLVQYGAKLVHDANDILDELPGGLRIADAQTAAEPESPLREVLAAFTREEGLHIDALATKLGRSVANLSDAVLQLELGGWLKALPGARYIRAR
jgi:DNA processing protein